MGGILRYRGGYLKASVGRIFDCGGPPQASCSRIGYPDPQIRREGRIHLSLPPRARVRSPPLCPGLMFYYGLHFHDLAPDSFLHVSVFIIMCEAFLRIPPHFGLWLKTFNVKPKVVDGK